MSLWARTGCSRWKDSGKLTCTERHAEKESEKGSVLLLAFYIRTNSLAQIWNLRKHLENYYFLHCLALEYTWVFNVYFIIADFITSSSTTSYEILQFVSLPFYLSFYIFRILLSCSTVQIWTQKSKTVLENTPQIWLIKPLPRGQCWGEKMTPQDSQDWPRSYTADPFFPYCRNMMHFFYFNHCAEKWQELQN